MKSATERFAALVTGPEADLRLDEAALLIAAHAHPGLDVGHYVGRLDDMAAACPEPTLAALRHHLFETLGFRGNEDDYGDPGNSFLDEVIERRLGLPITLSVVTIEVGRRLGVALVGVGLPGHFLVRHEGDPPVLLDPFNSGRVLEPAACAVLLRRTYGGLVPFDESLLAPAGPRAILARILANLKQVYLVRSDTASAEWVMRLRATIPEVGPAELAELASAQAATGRFGAAARTLEELAAHLPDEQAAEAAARAVQLRARLN